MTAFPAAGLTISAQAAASDGTIGVVFNWSPGFGGAGETVNYQFLDVTINPYDFTCGVPNHYCIQVPANVGTWVLNGLRPVTIYGWRVNTNFHFGPGNDQFVLSNPTQTTFTTANATVPPIQFPPLPLPPFPNLMPVPSPLPPFPIIFPNNIVHSSPVPTTNNGSSNGIIPNPAPVGTTFSPNQVLTAIWQYTNLSGDPAARLGDALALVIATAGAETAGTYSTDACGDCDSGNTHNGQALQCIRINDGRGQSCFGTLACSWGLFQLNRCGGQGAGMSLAQLTDPFVNSSVGVPPIMQQINAQGLTNQRDYTLQQVANVEAPAGHPGGAPDVNNSLSIAIFNEYNRIKFTVRQTTFPM